MCFGCYLYSCFLMLSRYFFFFFTIFLIQETPKVTKETSNKKSKPSGRKK